MRIIPIKTDIVTKHDSIEKLIDRYITRVSENSVVIVTSKIISIIQGDVVSIDSDKSELIYKESEKYLLPENNPFRSTITITGHKLSAAAGIDESNADNVFVLLPSKVQSVANELRVNLQKKYSVVNIGVIITDSRSSPLYLGTHGVAMAYSGIKPLKDYIGTNDLFGRKIQVSRLNIVNGIASAAVTLMGEGEESTPIAIATELDADIFSNSNPTELEISEQYYEIENDLYAELLQTDKWLNGGGGFLARQ
jgi:F420-0:gamma-glutamyl ligase